MYIEAYIQQEFVDLDVANTVDYIDTSCVHCWFLPLNGETTGLGPGRYSLKSVHYMTVHGEEASMQEYACCANIH